MTTTTTKNPRKLFVNLPVRDLAASKAFFAKLGFEFNPQFTDEKAACMIFSDEAFAMLLSDPFFQGFTKRPIADTSASIEVILAFSVDSRAEVDRLVDAALASGAKPASDPQDHGFMYYRTFHDLDGHHWEVIWMDPSHVQPQ